VGGEEEFYEAEEEEGPTTMGRSGCAGALHGAGRERARVSHYLSIITRGAPGATFAVAAVPLWIGSSFWAEQHAAHT